VNLKKAKQLRRLLRESGTPVTEYQQHPRTGVIAMVPTCRRALYQAMKKLA